MTHTISNSDDIIDSRDVIQRIDELTDEHAALVAALAEATEAQSAAVSPLWDVAADLQADLDAALDALEEWHAGDDAEELKALSALQEEGEGCSDWQHGATLINDSHFEDYARDLAEDMAGNELRDARWPFDHIDWEAAAEALKQDYTSVDFNGTTYWVRV